MLPSVACDNITTIENVNNLSSIQWHLAFIYIIRHLHAQSWLVKRLKSYIYSTNFYHQFMTFGLWCRSRDYNRFNCLTMTHNFHSIMSDSLMMGSKYYRDSLVVVVSKWIRIIQKWLGTWLYIYRVIYHYTYYTLPNCDMMRIYYYIIAHVINLQLSLTSYKNYSMNCLKYW